MLLDRLTGGLGLARDAHTEYHLARNREQQEAARDSKRGERDGKHAQQPVAGKRRAFLVAAQPLEGRRPATVREVVDGPANPEGAVVRAASPMRSRDRAIPSLTILCTNELGLSSIH